MKYVSTRNLSEEVSGAYAIAKGIAPDGGLYVPKQIPKVSLSEIEQLIELDYCERATKIISLFLPEMQDKLKEFTSKAYSRFDGDPAPLVKTDEYTYMLELWHGPTHAFKDMALTLLPYLLTYSKKLIGENSQTLVLVATSGDTGKAALEGFRDVENTKIAVIYPQDGVSALQKLQMKTQEGDNVFVTAIKGNFDDAQTAVKKVFASSELNQKLNTQYNVKLSSANSINWGRLVPQIAYYFSAYADLVGGGQIALGDEINFCVPSGNFGNILAGWYAKQMGLPVNKFICASNCNNVLTEFITCGKYNSRREFYKTTSPSMDILVSSNLERLIFELSGRNDKLTAERMQKLFADGSYQISNEELTLLKNDFTAGFSTEKEVSDTIFNVFDDIGYIIDPHTAVAVNVYDKYADVSGEQIPTVVVSTASPYKFVSDVLKAIDVTPSDDDVKNIKKLYNETALPIPETISVLPTLKRRFAGVIDKDEVALAVEQFAKK